MIPDLLLNDEFLFGGAAVIGAFLSWFVGDLNGVVKVLFVMVVFDYSTGVVKGFITKTWNSEVGAKGIAKKFVIFAMVGIANVIDHELMGATEFARDAVCFFYIANEGISILENAIAIGAPIPETLKERFLEWRNEGHHVKKDTDSEHHE